MSTRTKSARDVQAGDTILTGRVGGFDQKWQVVVSAKTIGEDTFIAVAADGNAAVIDLPAVGAFDPVDVKQ